MRGATERLEPHEATAETTESTALTAFTSDGFSVGSESNVNLNNGSLVAWAWDAGSTTSSNTDGSITSSVRANPSAGFSIVSYTGTGTAGTIGHGLNAKPSITLIKSRDSADSWYFYTDAIDGSMDYNQLEGSGSFGNSSISVPTSSVFSVGLPTALTKQVMNLLLTASRLYLNTVPLAPTPAIIHLMVRLCLPI